MSADIEDPTLETTVLDELPTKDEPSTEPAVVEPAAPKPTETDELRSAMTELAGTVKKLAQPKDDKPAPTPEQIAEYWGIYNPEAKNKEFFKQFFRLGDDATPEQLAAAKELFTDMHGGIMKQSVTAIKNYLRAMREELDSEYAPLREYIDTQKREQIRSRFFEAYPGLNEPRFDKIIRATATVLDGKTFADEKDYFKALAEGAAGSIKEILPEFDLGAKPTTTNPGKTPKLPRTGAGGGGGAGKGATHDALAASGRKNDIDSLSDDAE